MKKYIYIALTVLVINACDILDKEPIDFTAPTTWYSTQEELEMSMAGVYSYLHSSYEMNLAVWFPLGNDLYFDRSSTSVGEKIQFYTHSTSNPEVLSAWHSLYKGINNANMFLENMDNAKDKVSQKEMEYYRGEALFLRAYFHFMLTSYWGDVPYRDKSTSSASEGHKAVTPRADIFKLIIKDMEEAESLLPEISHYNIGGRANRSAAKGILARMCLYAAGFLKEPSYYADAHKWSKSLIDDNIHTLNPSFENVFVKYMKDEYDIKESIFEIEAYGNERSNNSMQIGMWSCYYSQQFGGLGNDQIIPIKGDPDGRYIARGRGVIVTTPHFMRMFEQGDLRRDWTVSTQLYKANTNPAEFVDYNPEFAFRYPGKFRRLYEKPPVYTWGNSANMPLLRYSDVLLMFAEADNEINSGPSADAIEAANKVRRRGYGKPMDMADPSVDIPGMGYSQFKEFIFEERARELAFETHRKLDLIRWGILLETLRKVGDDIASIPLTVYDPVSGKNIPNPVIVQTSSGVSQVISDLTPSFKNAGDRNYLMPIPEDEMTTNSEIVKNNTGW